MVSIPDWSRFGCKGANVMDLAQQSKYNKQREMDIIKQAEEQGYFLSLTKTFIEDMFSPEMPGCGNASQHLVLKDSPNPKDLTKVKFIALTNAHLRSLGEIGLCRHLRICVLSSNYISRIDALAVCNQLVKLDASSNQISVLPGPDFWEQLENLKILHLHDNPVGRIESLTYLSSASQLVVLTLYDTPLSLKRNYRHHVVNSVWSLKALDHHVISDEEIIEDADFSGRFSVMQQGFKANLYPKLCEKGSYEDQMRLANKMLVTVNHILAHYSPVLMIQKFIRGHLVRRQYKCVGDARIWAAVTIQRGFRGWKGLPVGEGQEEFGPRHTTSPIFGPQTVNGVDVIKMDFDTYLQNRRPGSNAQSEASHISGQLDGRRRSSSHSATQKQRKNLFINLTKLQMGTLQTLQDDAVATETIFPLESSLGRDEARTRVDGRCVKKKRESEVKSRRIKNIKQFFGPVVHATSSPEPQMADDEEIPIVHFRLRGFKKVIQVNDPTTDLILGRREAGRNIRAAEFDHDIQVGNEPKPKVHKKRHVSNLERMLNKAHGTMGLSCLHAVQQAYKTRERMERQAQQIEYVLNIRDQRENARDRIKMYHNEKRSQVLKERDADQKKILEEMDRKGMQAVTYMERNNELRSKSCQHWRQRRGELSFMTDFNIQNTSVSNALMRHDRQAQQEDRLHERSELVQAHKMVEKDQQNVVKKYLEHRQLMRQAEAAMSRAALDTKMLQEANERLMEARSRVAQRKARTAHVEASLAFPAISTPALPHTTMGTRQTTLNTQVDSKLMPTTVA